MREPEAEEHEVEPTLGPPVEEAGQQVFKAWVAEPLSTEGQHLRGRVHRHEPVGAANEPLRPPPGAAVGDHKKCSEPITKSAELDQIIGASLSLSS